MEERGCQDAFSSWWNFAFRRCEHGKIATRGPLTADALTCFGLGDGLLFYTLQFEGLDSVSIVQGCYEAQHMSSIYARISSFNL